MNGNQTRPADGDQNDQNRHGHVDRNVKNMNEDFTPEILLAALGVDAEKRVGEVLQQTDQQRQKTKVNVIRSRAQRLTFRRPVHFDPAIQRDEGEDPRETKVQFVIETKRETSETGDKHEQQRDIHGEESTPEDRNGKNIDLVDDVEKVLQTGEQIENVDQRHDQEEETGGMSTEFL